LTGEALFQALGDNAYELDDAFRFLTFNAGCEAYYGVAASAALGRPIWDVLPPTRGSELDPVLRAAMAARRPARIEMAGIVHPDRWIEVTLFPTARGLGVAFRDRTAEHRAEKALRESEERLRLAQRAAGIGVFDWHIPSGRVVWSEEQERIFGLEPGTFEGTIEGWRRRVLQEDLTTTFHAIDDAMARGHTALDFAFRVRRPDGSIGHVEGTGAFEYTTGGAPLRVIGVNVDITARRDAEEALRDGAARLRLAQESGRVGLWDWEVRTGRVIWSDMYYRIWGLDPGMVEPSFDAFLAAVHSDDRARVMGGVLRVVQDPAARVYEAEFRVPQPHGLDRWLLARGEVSRDAGTGEALRLTGVCIDVTERRRAEEALRHSEMRLRLATEGAHIGIWEQDLVTGRGWWSREAAALFSVVRESFTATDWTDVIHPEDRGMAAEAWRRAVEEGAPYEVEFRAARRAAQRDERWLLSRGHVERTAAGVALRGSGVLLDVTARRRAEDALRRSEERLRLAQDAGEVGSWDWDIGTGELHWSDSCHRLHGTDPTRPPSLEEWRGGIHPEDRPGVEEALRTSLEGKSTVWAIEFRFSRVSDGALRWIGARGSIVRDPADDRPLRVLGVALDLTERREAEERQVLLARELDHRAKNALAVVQAAVRLTPKDNASAFARTIEGRVGALARAHTLLAEARWSGADLRALAEAELTAFLPSEGTTLSCAPRAVLDGPPVRLGPTAVQALSMALHELATNATKYGALSGPEGRLSLFWKLDRVAGLLCLRWLETGGPPLSGPPARAGFGTRVLKATLCDQLGGTLDRRWEGEGLVCRIELPLIRIFSQDAGTIAVAGSI